jgi:hypothetical protein
MYKAPVKNKWMSMIAICHFLPFSLSLKYFASTAYLVSSYSSVVGMYERMS